MFTGNSRNETFRHVGDNYTDQEDDSSEPVVTKNERDDEEGDSEEDGDASNQMDKVFNLASNWSHARIKISSQVCNSTHNSTITGVDHDTFGGSFHRIGREESNVAGLQWVLKY